MTIQFMDFVIIGGFLIASMISSYFSLTLLQTMILVPLCGGVIYGFLILLPNLLPSKTVEGEGLKTIAELRDYYLFMKWRDFLELVEGEK